LERCVAALLERETLDEPALRDLTRDLKRSKKAEKTVPTALASLAAEEERG
jgi:hypothetical protein